MDERPRFESRYRVGVEQVDQEHSKLFEIAGRVYDSLSSVDDSGMQAAKAAVDELIAYTNTHFASEESLMEAASYPALDYHRELHQRLLTQVQDMQLRVELEQRYAPLDLSRFLYRWLVSHIEAEDKKFGDFYCRADCT